MVGITAFKLILHSANRDGGTYVDFDSHRRPRQLASYAADGLSRHHIVARLPNLL